MLKRVQSKAPIMVVPDVGPAVWIGIAIGVLGISFWVVGLLAFDYLLDRYQHDPHAED